MPAVEDQSAPEHIPKPKNEVVDAFREEINRWFVRYQTFYDRTNAAMRDYRLIHVELVSTIYQGLMTVFGDRIEEVRVAAYELEDLITEATERVGTVDPCIQAVVDAQTLNSAAVGTGIQSCAIIANTTLSGLLQNVFYPTFAQIQTETSRVPISVIDVLSRGNVLEDEDAILQYLADRYEVFELQWLAMVSQMLRWETNRFENDGLFLTDDSSICLTELVWQFLLTNSRLEGEVMEC